MSNYRGNGGDGGGESYETSEEDMSWMMARDLRPKRKFSQAFAPNQRGDTSSSESANEINGTDGFKMATEASTQLHKHVGARTNSDALSTSRESTSMKRIDENPSVTTEVKKTTCASKILIGKRRGGGKMLPIGVIKRSDAIKPVGKDANKNPTKEPWSRYMAEVERYKSQTCTEETPNRSLVK